MKSLFGMIALWIAGAGAASADMDVAQVTGCLSRATAERSDPAACIEDIHAPCLDNAQETPAVALLCLERARDGWSAALGGAMADLVATAQPGVARIARIETKYDLLSNLLQCDRLKELSLAVSDLEDEAIAVQDARCRAIAPALGFMRLYLRGKPLKTE